jgi:hypothetical protein
MPPFEVWIAVAAVYAGVSYFVPAVPAAGNTTLVHRAFPWAVALWSALYAAGGVAILAGLVRRSPRIEGFGLHLLGSGITVALIAALVAGAPIVPTIVVQGGVAAACVARLLDIR